MTKIEDNGKNKVDKPHKMSKNHKKKQKERNKALKTAINKNIEKIVEDAKKEIKENSVKGKGKKNKPKEGKEQKTSTVNQETVIETNVENASDDIQKADKDLKANEEVTDDSSQVIIDSDKEQVTSDNKTSSEEQPKSKKKRDKKKENQKDQNILEGIDQDNKKEEGSKPKSEETKKDDGPDYSVFVGNLPPFIKASKIKQLFNKFGEIKSIRFRTDDGAVIFHKKQLKKMKSVSCYVRYVNEEDSKKALEMNNSLVEDHHIRVNLANVKPKGHNKSTVFVGNISYSEYPYLKVSFL